MATIVTKNSSTASAVPTTSDLVQGELAVNVTDKRIFTENASTQIVELGTNPSTITTGSATVTGTLTANGTFASNNAVITGGSINSTPIGATTPSTVRGSTVTATTGFVGGLTGNVTGNLTGNVTGNVVGNLTGNVTGNVTASTGTTTLNNLVVNGTADFTNTKLTNITTPTLDSDAANKGYVDATVAAVIDSAPAALDTLNELAAALGDDANFSATVTTALATKLPLAGGTMTGAIAMGTSKITGLGDPTASQDAATKIYVDTADNLKLNLSGGTMSGAIAMGTNKITGLGDPTLAQDAATKAYTDSILGSATSAAASAAAAATSESNAATSASNAATSETNALNSANAAASSYDQFDDRYLGDKASDPTLDNDGNALLTGALYFNTTTDVMRVYTGSAWQDVAISTNSPTFTGTVTADGLSLGDNDKATFGASNDLEIYHDGSNSFINDIGTGNLIIQGSTAIRLRSATGENMGLFNAGGAVTLQHSNSTKFATTATGIDVTGTATMDGLTVDGDVQISDTTVLIDLMETDTVDVNTRFQHSAGDFLIRTLNDAKSVVTTRLSIDHATGDISFYEDTGTTPKFFWDASAESLGIGTVSPAAKLDVNGTALTTILKIRSGGYITDGGGNVTFNPTSGGSLAITSAGAFTNGNIVYNAAAASGVHVWQTNGAERMRIDSSGNVGIGTTSPVSFGKLAVVGSQNISVNQYIGSGVTSYNDSSEFSLELGTFNDTAVNNGTTYRWKIANVGAASGRALSFNRITRGGSYEEVIRITSSGAILLKNAPAGNALQFGTTSGGTYAEKARVGINASNGLDFAVNGTSPDVTIDSSGNLLVGTTSESTWTSTEGAAIRENGTATFTRNNNIPLYANRLTSDGTLVDFRKDGATVGSIGVNTNVLYIGGTEGTDAFIGFGNDIVRPVTSTGASRDNAIDLGYTGMRFKDLYLSGGVYLGGTGADNKLDDYEEGTWTPTINSGTISASEATYTKIGNVVTLRANIGDISDNTTATDIQISGLPFTASSTNRAVGSSIFRYFSKTDMAQVTPYVGQSSTFVNFYVSFNSDSTYTPLQFDDGTRANMDIIFTITYATA